MKTKFTKGEWVNRDGEIGVVDKSDTQSYGMLNIIATVDSWDFPENNEANARLIAQAPAMYEMLETVDGLISTCQNETELADSIINMCHDIDQLLAKCRGEI